MNPDFFSPRKDYTVSDVPEKWWHSIVETPKTNQKHIRSTELTDPGPVQLHPSMPVKVKSKKGHLVKQTKTSL
jgi:hypothetical protein